VRAAATGFTVVDLNKLALQLDNNTLWMLVGLSPVTWQRVSYSSVEQNNISTMLANPGFGRVGVGGSLVIATAAGDTLNLQPGEGVSLVGNAGNKSVEIGLDGSFVDRVNNVRRLVAGTNIVLTEQGADELVVSASGLGGGGVTAHGDLTGLHLDQHLQYLTTTRHSKTALHALTRVNPVTGLLEGSVPHDELDGLTDVVIDRNNIAENQVLMFRTVGGDAKWRNVVMPLATSAQDGLMSKTDKSSLTALLGGSVSAHATNHYMDGGSDLIPVATTTRNGLMSKNDKIALNNLVGSSDERLKKNIEKVVEVTDVMAILRGMDAIYFNWNTSVERAAGYGDQREVGFLAQQVDGVLPEVVGDDGMGYLTLDYAKMVPILAEAIKIQQRQIDDLNAKVSRLQKQRTASI
jgi:hypothetical protein